MSQLVGFFVTDKKALVEKSARVYFIYLSLLQDIVSLLKNPYIIKYYGI
jgi:hypothetical protein